MGSSSIRSRSSGRRAPPSASPCRDVRSSEGHRSARDQRRFPDRDRGQTGQRGSSRSATPTRRQPSPICDCGSCPARQNMPSACSISHTSRRSLRSPTHRAGPRENIPVVTPTKASTFTKVSRSSGDRTSCHMKPVEFLKVMEKTLLFRGKAFLHAVFFPKPSSSTPSTTS